MGLSARKLLLIAYKSSYSISKFMAETSDLVAYWRFIFGGGGGEGGFSLIFCINICTSLAKLNFSRRPNGKERF